MKPRMTCECGKSVALQPVARAAGMGMVFDHKRTPKSLVLCPLSETIVPIPDQSAYQDPLPGVAAGLPRQRRPEDGEQDTLFGTYA